MKYLIAAIFLIFCVITLLLPEKKKKGNWSIDDGYPIVYGHTDSTATYMVTYDHGLTWQKVTIDILK